MKITPNYDQQMSVSFLAYYYHHKMTLYFRRIPAPSWIAEMNPLKLFKTADRESHKTVHDHKGHTREGTPYGPLSMSVSTQAYMYCTFPILLSPWPQIEEEKDGKFFMAPHSLEDHNKE